MGELSKGMNDTYLVEERIRCQNQTFEYEKARYAWYRHYLDLPAGICEKRVVLDFEGIALISAVYINGKKSMKTSVCSRPSRSISAGT